ncbi:hypothetical protein DMO16_09670 [Fictibacillus sp. S7]|nr:hypothetical protein DMO16_09670 [Fictibacillus sp. S7]
MKRIHSSSVFFCKISDYFVVLISFYWVFVYSEEGGLFMKTNLPFLLGILLFLLSAYGYH